MVAGQERTGRLETHGGVVVAGGDDDLQLRTARRDVGQESVVEFLRSGRRVAVVEHVACHKQRIGLRAYGGLGEPVEEVTVLGAAVDAVEHVAHVPVASSYQFHVIKKGVLYINNVQTSRLLSEQPDFYEKSSKRSKVYLKIWVFRQLFLILLS